MSTPSPYILTVIFTAGITIIFIASLTGIGWTAFFD